MLTARQGSAVAVPKWRTWLAFLLRAEPRSSQVSNPAERAGCCHLPMQGIHCASPSAIERLPKAAPGDAGLPAQVRWVRGLVVPLLSPWIWAGPCLHCCRAAQLLPSPVALASMLRHVRAIKAQGQHTLSLCTVQSAFPAASPSHCTQIHRWWIRVYLICAPYS